MLPPDARPETVGPFIASQGANDMVCPSRAVLGQGHFDQTPAHPSPPRLRPYIEVDASSHAALDPTTVEPDGPLAPVSNEEDGCGLAGTPIGQRIEGAEVGTGLRVP